MPAPAGPGSQRTSKRAIGVPWRRRTAAGRHDAASTARRKTAAIFTGKC